MRTPARTATLVGLAAIALWSLLAELTVASGRVPPFELAALCFAIGAAAGALPWLARPSRARALRQPPRVMLLGVAGLFGYHALYFAALRRAPPAEAGLLNYLWPLLLVLGGGLAQRERLRAAHVVGALVGFAGVAVLLRGSGAAAGSRGAGVVVGDACACAAAFVWAGYSIASRRLGRVPTDAVVGFCALSAVASAACHLAFERTVRPDGVRAWLAIVALGVGPLGVAFHAWDIGVKHGDIRRLGIASYAAPVLSTAVLVLAGHARASASLAIACGLIVAGAAIGTLGTLRGG